MVERFGYRGKIFWVDLTHKRFDPETRDEIFWRRHVGGGLVATALLLEKMEPGIDPLSGDNLLIFASSVVAGHPGVGPARFTTAAKSPLTDGAKETNAGGTKGSKSHPKFGSGRARSSDGFQET